MQSGWLQLLNHYVPRETLYNVFLKWPECEMKTQLSTEVKTKFNKYLIVFIVHNR